MADGSISLGKDQSTDSFIDDGSSKRSRFSLKGLLSGFGKYAFVPIGLAVGLASYELPRLIPFFEVAENWVRDARVDLALPTEDRHKDVVIVRFTEETLSLWPFRSPFNRAFMAELVAKLEAGGVKAIGIDVLFDTPTLAEEDAALKEVFDNATVPIVVSYGNPQSTGGAVNEEQHAYLDKFIEGENVTPGFANLVTDGFDGVVRYIYPGWREDYDDPNSKLHWGFAQRLAEVAGFPSAQIPTEKIAMDYRGNPNGNPWQAFQQFDAHVVVNKIPPQLMPRIFGDKIVVLGAELTAIDLDLHRTPFVALRGDKIGEMPGAQIHAHALAQILDERQFLELGTIGVIALFMAIGLFGALIGSREIKVIWLVIISVVSIVGYWVAGFYLPQFGAPMFPLVFPTLAFAAAVGLSVAWSGSQNRAEREFIQGAFSRYLSPALVEQLMDDPSNLAVKGEKREMSFIFTDVAGFTTFSEAVEPEVLVGVLNEYLEGMCNVIMKYDGTIDKFIGDAVFALFGAPVPLENHSELAVKCGIELNQFASEFQARMQEAGIPFGITRIGVHSGIATVGNFGSESRFEYTALGDAVNSAARLESLNKQFGTRLAVSAEAASRCPDVSFRPIAEVIVKGKTEPIEIFFPVTSEEAATPVFKGYSDAYSLLKQEKPAARQAFVDLLESFPDDNLIRLHARRIAEGELTTVMKLTEK